MSLHCCRTAVGSLQPAHVVFATTDEGPHSVDCILGLCRPSVTIRQVTQA